MKPFRHRREIRMLVAKVTLDGFRHIHPHAPVGFAPRYGAEGKSERALVGCRVPCLIQ